MPQPPSGAVPYAPGYAGVVLADHPLAYWRLGEPSGATRAADASGRGITGTYNASPTRGVPGLIAADDPPDAAAKFTAASSQYVDFGTPKALTDLGAMTVEFWINRTATGAQTILYKSDNNTTAGWWVEIDSTNSFGFQNVGSSANVRRFAAAPAVGSPAHVVITYDGGTVSTGIRIYLNGTEATAYTGGQNRTGTHATDAAVNLWLGKPGTNLTSYLNSTIDEVAIYSGVLAAGRIKQHYLAGRSLGYRPGNYRRAYTTALVSAGGAGITGTLSATLGALTSSAAGSAPITGTASQTLGALTVSAAGTAPITGTLSGTLGALTVSAAGSAPITGSASNTLGALTSSATGSAPITGSLSATLGALTVSAAGMAPGHGTFLQSLGALTSSATGSAPITGSLAQTLGALTVTAFGGSGSQASLSVTLGTLTVSAAGVSPVIAQASVTLGALGLAAGAASPVGGAFGGSLGPLTLSADGSVTGAGTGVRRLRIRVGSAHRLTIGVGA